MIRLAVFDNFPTYREGLKYFFREVPDIHIAGDAGNCADLFRSLQQTPVDMVLLGVNINRKSKYVKIVKHVDITRKIRHQFPNVKILAFASEDTKKTVQRMMNEGANGYIGKRQGSKAELEKAIRQVVAGNPYIGQIDSNKNVGTYPCGRP